MECAALKDFKKVPVDLEAINNRQKRHLITCFHSGNKETLAFWDTYAKEDSQRRKFALRFDRETLVKAITGLDFHSLPLSEKIHGKVRYKNLLSKNVASNVGKRIKYPSFRKEYAFAYEREYRIVLLGRAPLKLKGVPLPSQNVDFIIYVNPLLEEAEFESCLQVITNSPSKKNLKLTPITKWFKPELYRYYHKKRTTQ